jgi:hypothetical protein
MTDTLEEVPLDEVAELERIAEAAAQAAKLQKPERRPLDKATNAAELAAARGANWVLPQPPPPLRPYVDTAEVNAHLTQLSERLTRLEDQVTHTMLLVMILGDHARITTAEYNAARAKLAQVEGSR